MINISKFFNQDSSEAEKIELPMVPLKDIVLFPNMTTSLFIGREKSINALSHAMGKDKMIFFATQNQPDVKKPKEKDIHKTGTEAKILQLLRLPDGTIKILVQGIVRGRLSQLKEMDDYLVAEFSRVIDQPMDENTSEAAMRTVAEAFENYSELSGMFSKEIFDSIKQEYTNPSKYADLLSIKMPFKIGDKQQLLDIIDVEERLFFLLQLIKKETDVFTMSQKIKGRVKSQMEQFQKKHYLNEQMRAIKKEMGEDGPSQEFNELDKRIKRKRLPKNAGATVRKELEKLKMMSPMSSEATVVRNYIDWILDLPWYRKRKVKKQIDDAQRILDEDHYGLFKPKERILEYLAVQTLVNKIKGPILCLVGPPGVGKTSLSKSVARATGRAFARISLGGVRDEAEIRGHRRTYIGAMPGKIIQTLRKTGYNNPVFCLDEVDKMNADFRGDPSSALLEVLDPEQNKNFNDHYLELDYDLSEILFITTANTLHNIPGPLQDRMEIIHIPGYTEYEKERIAHTFLIPKQLKENGLKPSDVTFSNNAILSIIRYYTRESGVRNLEREISSLLRKIAKKIVQTNKRKLNKISATSVLKYLGQRRFRDSQLEKVDQIGVLNGLAWTQAGGELLTIEAVTMKGKGKVSVTGKLGDVMKESAQAAVSYVRSRSKELGIDDNFYKELDIHIHVPEGAIPKDGPSAGITICTAVVSVLTGKKIDRTMAMTGEITLRGRVLPVGGIKEKFLAAHANGIKTVIMSRDNEKDIKEDVPESIKKQLEIIFVESMDEVIKYALN